MAEEGDLPRDEEGPLELRHALGDEEAERVPVVAELLARHDLVGEDAKLDAEPLLEMRLQRLVRIVARRSSAAIVSASASIAGK